LSPEEPAGDIADLHRFSHRAMATEFGIALVEKERRYAREAAEAAFELLDRLERELSRFIENSEVSRINDLSPGRSLLLGRAAFECLELSKLLWRETEGVFDVTVGSLLALYREKKREGRVPTAEEIGEARRRTGMDLLELDRKNRTVRVKREGVSVDLGGMGKGYALDRMAELLREWGVESALLHGGRSTLLASGPPPRKTGWPVNVPDPFGAGKAVAHFLLGRGSVSGSSVRRRRHIVDPRSGVLIQAEGAAWSYAQSAAPADALSTAFMIMAPEAIEKLCRRRPEIGALIVRPGKGAGRFRILRYGKLKGAAL